MTKEVSKRKRRPRKKNASTPGIGSTRVPNRVAASRSKSSTVSPQNKFDIDTPSGRISLFQKVLSVFRGGAK
jgi:hypothetical protein